jgi:hypothetical protein
MQLVIRKEDIQPIKTISLQDIKPIEKTKTISLSDIKPIEQPQSKGLTNQQLWDIEKGVPNPDTNILPDANIIPEFQRGLQSSIPGMAYRQKLPEESQATNILERTAHSAGQYLGDSPFYAIGGAATKSPVGALALTQGIRKVLVDAYSKGKAKSWDDIKDRFKGAMLETGKGAVVGKALGVASKAPGIAKLPSEIAALTTAGSAVEGQIPSFQDFADATVFILGMHGVAKGAKAINRSLMNHWEKTAETPQQVVDKIKYGKNPQDVVPEIKKVKIEKQPTVSGSGIMRKRTLSNKVAGKAVENKLTDTLGDIPEYK